MHVVQEAHDDGEEDVPEASPIHRTPGVGIFLLDQLSFATPAAWTHFFERTRTIPQVAIFLEVQQVSRTGWAVW